MTQDNQALISTIEYWRIKACEYCAHSDDPLLPALTKSLEVLSVAVQSGYDPVRLQRTLASLKYEGQLTRQFERSPDLCRQITLGVLESLHAAFTLMIVDVVESETAAATAAAVVEEGKAEQQTVQEVLERIVEDVYEEVKEEVIDDAASQPTATLATTIEEIEQEQQTVEEELVDEVFEELKEEEMDDVTSQPTATLVITDTEVEEMEHELSLDRTDFDFNMKSLLESELEEESKEDELDDEESYYLQMVKDSSGRMIMESQLSGNVIKKEGQSSEESSADSDAEPSTKKARRSAKRRRKDPDWAPAGVKTPSRKSLSRKSIDTPKMNVIVSNAGADTEMTRWKKIIKKFWNAGFYAWYRTREEDFMELDGEENIEAIMEQRFASLNDEEIAFWMTRGVERFDIEEPSSAEKGKRGPLPTLTFEPRDSFAFTASIKERLAAFDSFFRMHRWKIDCEYPGELEIAKKEKVWIEQWSKLSKTDRSVYMANGKGSIPLDRLTPAMLISLRRSSDGKFLTKPIPFTRPPNEMTGDGKGRIDDDGEEDDDMPILSRMDE